MRRDDEPVFDAGPGTEPEVEPRSKRDGERETRLELAAAYHLVHQHGWGESIYNHIAARVPGEPGALLMKRNDLAYAEVTASNLVKVDMGGDLDEQAGVNRPGYVLHAGVMLARPDVNASLHLHTPEIIAVSTRAAGLRMLCQYAVRFYGRIGYHDYEGITDGLAERPRLVASLGNGIALVMRHHGALTVGRSIAQAFIAAKDLVEACRIQLLAESGGADCIEIAPAICESTVRQFQRHDDGRGTADWPSYLRDLDARGGAHR